MGPERICIRVIDLGPIKIEEGSDLAVYQLPSQDSNDSAPLSSIVSVGKLADSTTDSGTYSVESPYLAPSTTISLEKLSGSTSRSGITSSGNFPNTTPLSNGPYTQKLADSNPESNSTSSGEYTNSSPTTIIAHPTWNSCNPEADSLSSMVLSKVVDSAPELGGVDSSLGTSVTDSTATSSILSSYPKHWQFKDTGLPKIHFARLMESAAVSSVISHPPNSSAGPSMHSTIDTYLYALKNAIFNAIEAEGITTLAKTEAKVQQLQTEIKRCQAATKDAEKIGAIYKEAYERGEEKRSILKNETSRLQRELLSKDKQIAHLEQDVKDRIAELRMSQLESCNLRQDHEKTLEAKNRELAETREEKAKVDKVLQKAKKSAKRNLDVFMEDLEVNEAKIKGTVQSEKL